MQITTNASGDLLELRISGRLDNESSEHLTSAINDAVRLGSHSVTLDLSGVDYISSAGIGALVKAHKQFQTLRGYFGISALSPAAAEIIRLTGLSKILQLDPVRPRNLGASTVEAALPLIHKSDQMELVYEVYDLHPGATLTCEVKGDPGPLSQGVFDAGHCQTVDFPATAVGLGLGAFGRSFSDCRERFGEFLAVAGTAAQQPPNQAGKPDFQQVLGDFVPNLQVLYGLKCVGEFSHLVRFDRLGENSRQPLSALAAQFLTVAKTDLAVMVFLAESSGLIGTSLRHSPASAAQSGTSRLAHPEIRRWLSFTPDHTHAHTLTLAVGLVSRRVLTGDFSSLAPLLRPLGPGTDLQGHFHAVVFSYRPFKKRRLDLNQTVRELFETEDVQAVLHLLHDDRQISGGGESEFVRGGCWVGAISRVVS
jgi:anti-anti-sigma factor